MYSSYLYKKDSVHSPMVKGSVFLAIPANAQVFSVLGQLISMLALPSTRQSSNSRIQKNPLECLSKIPIPGPHPKGFSSGKALFKVIYSLGSSSLLPVWALDSLLQLQANVPVEIPFL